MRSCMPEIIEIVADVLEMSPDELSGESGPEAMEQWDSVSSLRILVQVERHFGIRLVLDQYRRARTVADLERLVMTEVVRCHA